MGGSQAEAAGVQTGWIIKEVDGKPFSLKDRLADVVQDFAMAKKADSTLTVKFDVRTSMDCARGNCKNSDQFPTESKEDCAEACHRSEMCQWWYLHKEDADSVCSLTRDVLGYGSESGSVTGSRTCLPESVRRWPHCVVVDSKLPATNALVRTDVRALVGTVDPKGCANQDCKNTDTFWVPSQAECAEACFKVPDCKFWSTTLSGAQNVCWLRGSNSTRVAETSAAFAARDCRPNAEGGQTRFFLIGGLLFVAAWIAREHFVHQFPVVGVIGELVTTSLQRTMGIAPKKMDTAVRRLRNGGDDGNSELQSLISEQATERMQIAGQGYF